MNQKRRAIIRLIGVDAGHGLYTAGKRCSKKYDKNETREWFLNNRIATKFCEKIEEYKDVQTIRLDDITGNTDIPLNTRVQKANIKKVKVVASIHANAGGGRGIETFVYNTACLKGETGKLAKLVNDTVVAKTGMINRGVKTGDFAIIRDTNMDAFLIECGFMDNANDVPIILTDEFAEKVADGMVEAFVKYYSLKKVDKKTVKKEETKKAKAEKKKVDVIYQTYTNGRWQPNIKNTEDYAGVLGLTVTGIYANLSKGNIKYKVHIKNGKWLPTVTNRKDYAGILGQPIDAIMIKSTKGKAKYRVHIKNGNWLPWVTGFSEKNSDNGFAGILGKEIDAIQVEII